MSTIHLITVRLNFTSIPFHRAILRDEEVYYEPDKFIPERFLTEDGQLNPNVPDSAPTFGYGRRVCPGMFMASDSLWITAAYLVWAFNIDRYVDEAGNVDQPTGEFTFGLVRCA